MQHWNIQEIWINFKVIFKRWVLGIEKVITFENQICCYISQSSMWILGNKISCFFFFDSVLMRKRTPPVQYYCICFHSSTRTFNLRKIRLFLIYKNIYSRQGPKNISYSIGISPAIFPANQEQAKQALTPITIPQIAP